MAAVLAAAGASGAQATQHAALVITGTATQPAPATSPTSATTTSPAPPATPIRGQAVLSFGGAPATQRAARSRARTAGDPGVTIADFHFSPGTTTVHVGDTITWSNSGPSSHSATAGNGSFNTGILKRGQSASHTFTQAGTFTYFCEIHPYMHGTVVVLASTTPATTTSTQTAAAPSAAATTATSSPTATASAASGPTLPVTGLDVFWGLIAGLLMIGFGAILRRSVAP